MANKDGRPPVENPKQSVLGVRVTLEDHERIKTYAAEHHKTISQCKYRPDRAHCTAL